MYCRVFISIFVIALFSSSVFATCFETIRSDESSTPQQVPCSPDSPDYWEDSEITAEQLASLDPGIISENWETIKSSSRFNDIQKLLGSKVNELTSTQLQDITAPEAVRSVNGQNIKHISPGALKAAGANTLNDEQIGGLIRTQIQEVLEDYTGDWNKFNRDERDAELARRSGVQVQLNFGPQGGSGQVFADGFTLDSVQDAQIGTAIITQGQGISFRSGTLQITSADAFVDSTTVSTHVRQVTQSATREFSLVFAEQITSDCITIYNLSNSTVKDGQEFTVLLSETSRPSAKDCSGQTSTMQSLSDNAILSMTRDQFTTQYTVRNLSLDFAFPGYFFENVTTTDDAQFNTSRGFGIVGLFGGKGTTYTYQDSANPASLWQFSGPEHFSLKIRKDVSHERALFCSDCALFDRVDHAIISRGRIITKKKALVGQDTIERFDLVTSSTTLGSEISLGLDNANAIVTQETIINRIPEIISQANTYFRLSERIYQGQATGFFVLDPSHDPITTVVVKSYRLRNFAEEVTVAQNEMTITNNRTVIHALPPSEVPRMLLERDKWHE